ncbi:MAG: heme-binding protein, partial [Lentisphaeraceae bacterium]|nr:heme-binding protein [Lentisphaeraceae bacterium]
MKRLHKLLFSLVFAGSALSLSAKEKQPAPKKNIEQHIKTFSAPKNVLIKQWADSTQTKNPSSFFFGSKGELYVCEVNRWRFGVDDIRQRQSMLLEDLLIQSSEDRLKMFKNHLSEYPMSWYTAKSDTIKILKDTNGDGRADSSKVFADGFNAPLDGPGIGVIERDGIVYYTNIPHVWKLEDTDGDDVADKRTSLQDGFGIRMSFSGHDLHGLIWGPDGKLYWSVGDRGYSFTTKEGKKY